jgi:hypothetical protein
LKIRTDLQETRQGVGAAEVKADGFEPFVETADDVEDEGAVGDGLAEVAEVLSLALVAPAIVSDGEIALTEGPEVGVGVQGARGLIPEELGLNGEPNVAGGGAMLGDGVGEVVGDGAEEPSPHDTVHANPVGGVGSGGVREDMALQGVPPKGEEEGLAPPSIEGGGPVEAEWDEEADVLHGGRLRVEVEEGGGLVLGDGIVDGLVVDSGEGGGGVVVVVDGRRGKIRCSALPRDTVERVAKASLGHISICLSRGGLAFCSSCTGECSVTGGLAGGGTGGRRRPAIRMKGGIGGRGSADVVGHEQRRRRAGAAPGRAWSSARCGRIGLGENLGV